MKKYILLLFLLSASANVFACVHCNPQVMDGIYNTAFYPTLFKIFSAFIVLTFVVALLVFVATKSFTKNNNLNSNTTYKSPVPITMASMIIGIGLGGFIDGIVFHQILQWHEMLSNVIPATDYVGKSINMFWDGIFHAFCFIVVFIGILLLWKIGRRKEADLSGKLLTGGLVSGWAMFNCIEGVINHHILKLHNVMEFSIHHEIANWIFLVTSFILLAVGYLIMKSVKKGENIKN